VRKHTLHGWPDIRKVLKIILENFQPMTMPATKNIALFVTAFALLMETIDATILNTAIPAMSHSLQVNPIDLKVALISYFLGLALFVPVSGFLADKFGAKRIFIAAFVLFTVSSWWCGLVHNVIELVVARILQGIGGSLTLPIGRLIVARVFPQHEMITAMNRIAMVGALGTMMGPVLGGLLTYYVSWHWIFWVNVPLGFLVCGVAYRYLPHIPQKVTPPLDIPGFILFGMSLGGLTFGLSAFSNNALPLWQANSILCGAFGLLLIYFWYSSASRHPIFNTQLFAKRSFRLSMLGSAISRLGFGGIPFLVPLLLQVSLGYSSFSAGLLMAPWALGIVLAKLITLPSLRWLGYQKYLVSNTVFLTLSIWSFSCINSQTSFLMIGTLVFLYGFMISMQYAGMNTLAYAEINSTDLSGANSMLCTLQQLGQCVGVAVCAILITIFSNGNNGNLSVSILHETFFALGIIMLLAAPVFLMLQREDGQQMFVAQTATS
jgi:EmrB/QacA subfamily drug resistance transporter